MRSLLLVLIASALILTPKSADSAAIAVIPAAVAGVLFVASANYAKEGSLTKEDQKGVLETLQGFVSRDTKDQEAETKAVMSSALMKAKSKGNSKDKCDENLPEANTRDCPPKMRETPYQCCQDFMKTYQEKGLLAQVGEFAYQIWYMSGAGQVVSCCFEWDKMHGRFEIFKSPENPANASFAPEGKSAGKPYEHLGERSCSSKQDIDEDPCQATYPEKADANLEQKGRHFPRQNCP